MTEAKGTELRDTRDSLMEDRRLIIETVAHYETLVYDHRIPYIVRMDARARLEELFREQWILESEIVDVLKKLSAVERRSDRIRRIINALSAE